jgi:hypothetical protein
MADTRPGAELVPVSPYGPLNGLVALVREQDNCGRFDEALAAIDAYEWIAGTFGDEKTVDFLIQRRMYTYLFMAQYDPAVAAGAELLGPWGSQTRVRRLTCGFVRSQRSCDCPAALATAERSQRARPDGRDHPQRQGLRRHPTQSRPRGVSAGAGGKHPRAVPADNLRDLDWSTRRWNGT